MSAEVKSMKEWALYYAELGLAVFPLAYRNKVPAIEGGCKAATTEKSKIERWWNQNPRYNIGIATGNKSNGLVVIDLDVDKNKGIDGYEVLRDWQNKHGELPETWQSITGRGGYHYFYKDTITHSNKVGLYEGVDIRGEGGYIVAPPSVHPNIIDELYCCIVIGMSYDKMNKKKFVALDRKDFYAYRKKTLAVFRAALQACNRYPF